jgi:N-acetylglucosaminyldiphosphoundecaprenol N-acetyl-beta-D-mannosaminyltransferase
MKQYFGVKLDFDKESVINKIQDNINKQACNYICVVDANVLTIVNNNNIYRNIVNSSLINLCDGSSIAFLAGLIHNKNFQTFNGPEIFSYLIEKPYRQLLLGSSEDIIVAVKEMLKLKGYNDSNIQGYTLPYCDVNDFNYLEIARHINDLQPEIIWVSLGAPKQEIFMNRIKPLLSQGTMLGIGAAVNFYLGNLNLWRLNFGALKFIWISRIISEPRKQIKRLLPYVLILPYLFVKELTNYKKFLF